MKVSYLESDLLKEGKIIAGIDEAGRGAIAGPVVAAAILLKENQVYPEGIDDSKKLSPKKRSILFKALRESSTQFTIGIIDNYTIDKINILESTFEAMKAAVKNLHKQPDYLLIDGNFFRNIGIPYSTVIGGDAKCLSIAAASIIAKVSRDNWMMEIADKIYPQYNFKSNKGYGTEEHFSSIHKYGLTPLHRRTFLAKYFNRELRMFE